MADPLSPWQTATAFAGHYFGSPEPWVAVVLPLVLSLAILLREALAGRYSRRLCVAYLVSLPLTYLTARWVVADEQRALLLANPLPLLLLVLAWRRVDVRPGPAFALTFLSCLIVDIACASDLVWRMGAESSAGFYLGIGGAGLLDGLVVIPVSTAMLVGYAHWRLVVSGAQLRTGNSREAATPIP